MYWTQQIEFWDNNRSKLAQLDFLFQESGIDILKACMHLVVVS